MTAITAASDDGHSWTTMQVNLPGYRSEKEITKGKTNGAGRTGGEK